MNFTKPLSVLVLIVFAFSPALADESKSVSYSLKKQGRVHFQDKTQDQVSAQDTPDTVHPADIEPAAGGFEMEKENKETSLSERIRLPRKN